MICSATAQDLNCVGCSRLGNLLGLFDREEVPEVKKHLVWVGRRMERP
jgi:hypothetical protein